jgi:SAM-dependent methyltransferase
MLRREIYGFAESVPVGSIVIDAGAGECQYKHLFQHCSYVSVDSFVGDESWDFSKIDIKADLKTIPLESEYADCVVCTEVLEHIPEPSIVLAELFRLLKKGGVLFATVPFSAREHQVPYDFFRYTRFGLTTTLLAAGFTEIHVKPVGGDFARLYGLMFEAMSHFDGKASIYYKTIFYLFRQFLYISSTSLEKYEQRSKWASTPPLFSVKAIKK